MPNAATGTHVDDERDFIDSDGAFQLRRTCVPDGSRLFHAWDGEVSLRTRLPTELPQA
jgi:hypothetical protein